MNIIVNETDSFMCREIIHKNPDNSLLFKNDIINFSYRYDHLYITRSILLDMMDNNMFDNKINNFNIIYLYQKDDKQIVNLFKNCSYEQLDHSFTEP